MGSNNLIFQEIIEWYDETGNEMLQGLPVSPPVAA